MYKFIFCLTLLFSNLAFAEMSPRPALELPLAKKAVFLDLVTADESVLAVGERGIILKSDDKLFKALFDSFISYDFLVLSNF